jgi:hypothetical protein
MKFLPCKHFHASCSFPESFKATQVTVLSDQFKPWGRLSLWGMSGKRANLKKEGIKKWRKE